MRLEGVAEQLYEVQVSVASHESRMDEGCMTVTALKAEIISLSAATPAREDEVNRRFEDL
jgi:hypothetical protein